MLEHGIVPASAGGYEIANSLRLNDDDSAYLSRTPASAGNRQKWTWSAWIKRSALSSNDTLFSAKSNTAQIYLITGDLIRVEQYNGAGGYNFRRDFSGRMRDTSAWYHLVVIYDSAQATEADRIKCYRNGEQLGVDYTYDIMSQNFQSEFNNTETHWLGTLGSQYWDGYMAEVHFIDGQALTPDNFGETGDYGEWKPIEYTGAYGVNGFYLDFENSGSLGADVSGNSNNWTPNNLAATDQMLDSPTNNFCTWNAVEPTPTGIFAEGNTHYYANAVTTKGAVAGTMGFSGKFYWEVFSSSTNQYHTERVGIVADDFSVNQNIGYDSVAWGYGSNGSSQYKWNNNSGTYLGSRQIGDIQMIAVDTDAGKVWFGRNGTWEESGNPATGANAQYTNVSSVVRPATSVYNTQNGIDGSIANFGQDSSFAGNKTAQGNADGNGKGDFYYTPPSGYLALCTQNLPDPTVIPSEHFNTVLYSGDGTSAQAISGVGFQPEFVWIKRRDSADNHQLVDVVRGASKTLFSNTSGAENTVSGQYVSSLDSDGFTTGSNGGVNHSSGTYVAWNWKANGSGSSNTNGTITSTVSANQDAGFSIVSYTGTGSSGTVGHGLSKAPEMLISKSRTTTNEWRVITTDMSATWGKFLELATTDAESSSTALWGASPTNTLFSLGTHAHTNGSGNNYIAYCFHSVDGFSKVGSYTGNGSTDGTFVYTGFRPAYVMIKRTDSAGDWYIWDAVRNEYNLVTRNLVPNKSNAEFVGTSNYTLDFTSNGFKHRGSGSDVNASGGSHIYYAVAENPFKHTNAR